MGRQVVVFVIFVICSFLPGIVGGRFMPDAWYVSLQKPAFNPPNWVFGPVWTLLYLLMGTSSWLVWKRAGWDGAGMALGVFAVHLVVNGLWTWLFFGLHRPDLAMADIVALWALIVTIMILFARHSIPAAILLLPYLVWVSFASVLNLYLWLLNRQA